MTAKRRNKAVEKTTAEQLADDKPAAGNWLTRLMFRPRVLVSLAAGVVLTAALPLCLDRLPDLHERSEYRLRTADITINEPPRYVPGDLLQQVSELA